MSVLWGKIARMSTVQNFSGGRKRRKLSRNSRARSVQSRHGAEPASPEPISDELLAAALGSAFQDALPSAQLEVDELRQAYPEADVNVLVKRVKGRAVCRLKELTYPDGDPGRGVLEVLAGLAMAVALLRGVATASEVDLRRLGARIERDIRYSDNGRQILSNAAPLLAAAAAAAVKKYQPAVAEQVFNAMGVAKPSKPGPVRDLYNKQARRKVWHARHAHGVANAVGGFGVQGIIDGGLDRVIVSRVAASVKRQEIKRR